MALIPSIKNIIFGAPIIIEKKNVELTPSFNGSYSTETKALNPYYGAVSQTYSAQTGMPWLAADARKAVLTEWFWQPIRGQPRRVDTNELRKYSNTIWVNSIVQAILNQITLTPFIIMPKKKDEYGGETDKENEGQKEQLDKVNAFFEAPNKNNESFSDILRAWLKDVLEIDAGVLVKVYSVDSYDFEHLEPRSGAPLLKPLFCPVCNAEGEGKTSEFKEKANRVLDSIMKAEKNLNKLEKELKTKNSSLIRPDYSEVRAKMVDIVSENTTGDKNTINYGGNEPKPGVSTCPFCGGTGLGRKMTEVYARDGASFLSDVDRTGWTYGYWQYSYSIPAHPMWFSRDEIIYFKQNNRSMSPYGFAALQSCLDVVKSLESSVAHNKTLFVDGAVPDGIVGVEDMSNEEMTRMKTTWENEVKGQPHKIVFVNKRTTFSPFAFNNREMQFLEGQKEAWNQVIANFNLTPSDLGITRELNRSSASSMGEQTRKKCIRPLMVKIEQLINKQLIPELGVKDIEFQFIIDDPTEERQQAEIAEIKLRNGLTTINRVLLGWGEETVEWGDDNPKEAAMGMMGDMPPGKNPGDPKSHHKPGEIREQRDAGSEAGKRERESNTNKPGASVNKDFQTAFQNQIPFNTTVQNLSTPLPFAVPKQNHPNTMSPYKELSGLCPGCGSEQMLEAPSVAGSLNSTRTFRCQSCGRNYDEATLQEAINTQEDLHAEIDPLAPKVNHQEMGLTPTSNSFNTRTTSQNTEGNLTQLQTSASIDTAPTKTDPFRKKKVKLVAEGEEERDKDEYSVRELNCGIKTEMEHTSNKKVATKIAMDHLDEDAKYYTKLREAKL